MIILSWLLILIAARPLLASAGPEIAGQSAVVMDSSNGQVLFEQESNQKMYPASTTKIMTAIIALEYGRMDDLVTIPAEASNVEGSAIGLQEGEQISLEDLVYALMLSSGNDSAVAIACHMGGSVEGFTRMMNQKASEIGAVNTHFNNPNGLPDPEHYCSAKDMALIARYAMHNPGFRNVVSTKVKTIHRSDPDAQTYLGNGNRLLWNYDGAVGIKTGYTNIAGQCLVSAAARDGRELITVVFKSEGSNIWTDSMKLLDYGFNEFELVCLADAGSFVADVPVSFGIMKTVSIQTGRTMTYNFNRDRPEDISQQIFLDEEIVAPVKAGSKLGELAFFSGELEIGRVDLLAQHEVGRRISAQWWAWSILAALLLVLLAIIRYHNILRRRRWEMYKQKYYW